MLKTVTNMKKLFLKATLCMLLSSFILTAAVTTSPSAAAADAGGIPSVYIDLDGGDDAFRAVSADKNHSEPGEISMTASDGGVIYSGALEKFSGHGFTSFTPSFDTNNKNSYNIKLEEKAELVPGAGKIKKWVLLAPRRFDGSRDSTGLSQLAAFKTFTELAGDEYFGIKGEYVDLYVNGDYRGVYILCERMNDGGAIDVHNLEKAVSGDGWLTTVTDSWDEAIRLGVRQYSYTDGAYISPDEDITGGYVLEVMFGMYEGCGFETAGGVYFSIKSPEICTQEMVQYIASEVQNFENALFSETGFNEQGVYYTNYADIKSLADTVLVYAFYNNFEYFRTSTYIYKDADGRDHDKLTFGPVWDFETTSWELSNSTTFFDTTFTYFNEQQFVWSEHLWRHGDFMAEMFRENEQMKDVLADVVTELEATVSGALPSWNDDADRWGGQFEPAADDYISAINSRRSVWFDLIWSDENLLFLDISGEANDDGTVTLSAEVGGDAGDVLWYTVDSGSPSTPVRLPEYSGSPVTVPADGTIYFCTVTGLNNAYFPNTPSAVFSSQYITMCSSYIKADREALMPPETEPMTETAAPSPNEAGGGCGSSLGAVYILLPTAIAVTILKKKKFK